MRFQKLQVKLNWIDNLLPIQSESAWQLNDSEDATHLRQWNGFVILNADQKLFKKSS